VVDEQTLACRRHGREVTILHHNNFNKAWGPGGWRRLRDPSPYVALFPRVAFANDVTVRLHPSEVPWWLRRTLRQKLAVEGIAQLKNVKHRLPGGS